MRKTEFILVTLLVTFTALIFTEIVSAAPVPDTGQDKCYDNNTEIACPQPGEPFYGQDANYSINPHSYTDLENGIVRDNVTGLEWQQATASGTHNWQEALDYCDGSNLGGHDDWRLPTVKELSFIADKGRHYPAIDTVFFLDTKGGYYWPSTTYVSNASYGWLVDLTWGGYVHYNYRSEDCWVKAVRGGHTSQNFTNNGDGTVTDNDTGLMWQQATAPETYTWEQSMVYCEGLELAGYSDWRLPNLNELLSLVDYGSFHPAIDTVFFLDTVGGYYWSSTTHDNGTSNAWDVYFASGYVSNHFKSNYDFVRAVRGGQCGSLGDLDLDGICDDGDNSTVAGDNPCTGGETVFCDDNFPDDPNPNQEDVDSDGIGDACDEVPPIPTLTEWGMIIFMTLMMGIGVMILHKRRMA